MLQGKGKFTCMPKYNDIMTYGDTKAEPHLLFI
jgi:hypothetical protein